MDSSHEETLGEIAPLKDPEKGQECTDKKIQRLKGWWTPDKIDRVAKWIENGTKGRPPEFVEVHMARDGADVYDLRGIDLSKKLRCKRKEKATLPYARDWTTRTSGGLTWGGLRWLRRTWIMQRFGEPTSLAQQ